ncbi:MAG: polyprenyl glycosylphosphotransferase [Flavobacteriales bacterium]|nr:polyprenyl glycosylphosphotransferase [Flavobacteriales bacterium]
MNTEQLKRIVFDLISATIAWILFFCYRKKIIEKAELEISETLIYGTVAVSLFWLIIYILSDNYKDVRRVSRLNELYTTIFQSVFGCLIIFFFLIIDDIEHYRNYKFYYESILVLTLSHFFITFLFRYMITNSMVNQIHNKKVTFNTILIGNPKSIIKIFNLIDAMPRSAGNKIIGYINDTKNEDIPSIKLKNLGNINNLVKILKDNAVEEAILSFDKKDDIDISKIIYELIYNNIRTKVTPKMVDVLSGKVKMQSFSDLSLIEIRQIKMSTFESCIKRIIDITCSILALILLSPILIIVSLSVKISSHGPIFYYQQRIGYNKKSFNIIKFRSMHIHAEQGTPLLSSENDNRITNLGKVMRKYRIDELPQFYNVLIGEMSLIGPRPEREFFAKQILLRAPHYKLIYKVKPGITSWGMVKFGYAENIDEMIARLKYDIIYLENLSLLNDFKVLVLTIFIVLQGRGK